MKIGGVTKTVGVKMAVPNGSGAVLFWDPNAPATPSQAATVWHDWTPGIPTSPTNLKKGWEYASSVFGTAPDEFITSEAVEGF